MEALGWIVLGVIAAYFLIPRIAPGLANLAVGGGLSSALGSLSSNVQKAVQAPQEAVAVESISGTSQSIAAGAPGVASAQSAEETSIIQAATVGSAFIPVVGPIISGILAALTSIARLFFKGADPTQVASAEVQQAYDILCLNLCTLGGCIFDPQSRQCVGWGPKILPQQLLEDAINAAVQGCEQAELDAEQSGKVDVSVYRRSLSNIQADMNSFANGVQSNPGFATPADTAVSLPAAQAVYFSRLLPSGLIGPGHWYAWSVQQGESMTNQFVNLLPQGSILQ